MTIEKVELKSVKCSATFSRETICFQAKIYVNDKMAGYCENDGHGGSTSVHLDRQVVSHTDFDAFGRQEIINANTWHKEFITRDSIVDLYCDYLQEEWQTADDWKKACRKNICFTLHSDDPNQYRQIEKTNHADDEKLCASLRIRYNENLKEILNKKYDKDFATSK